jgi:hypothetical protein
MSDEIPPTRTYTSEVNFFSVSLDEVPMRASHLAVNHTFERNSVVEREEITRLATGTG